MYNDEDLTAEALVIVMCSGYGQKKIINKCSFVRLFTVDDKKTAHRKGTGVAHG